MENQSNSSVQSCRSNTEEVQLNREAAELPPCPDGCSSCAQHLTRPCCVLLEVTQRCNLGCPVCFAASVDTETTPCQHKSKANSVSPQNHLQDSPQASLPAQAQSESQSLPQVEPQAEPQAQPQAEAQVQTQPQLPSPAQVHHQKYPEDPSLETIGQWYKMLYERAGACHIQLSGGEPTLRDDLEDIIILGKKHGFSYFQLNTNGLKLAEDPHRAQRLKAAGLTCVFLQFDGMQNMVHRQLRGRDLQALKEAAVDACAAAQLPVILVPTLAGGINEQELLPLIRYGISKAPVVRGIHVQPLARFGRTDVTGTRLTNTEVIALLEEQSGGAICRSHFSGGNAEHEDCSLNAHYFITDEGELEPSGVQRPACCGDVVDQARSIQARRWGTDLSDIREERPPKGSMDEFLWQTKMRSFAITGMAFMDEETLNLERLQQCYLFIVSPEGEAIPFCAYNIAHRNAQSGERSEA